MSIPKAALPFLGSSRGPLVGPATRLAAAGLSAASVLLSRLALRLVDPGAPAAASLPRLEFHAEAGALDGALYLDGELLGHLERVTRL